MNGPRELVALLFLAVAYIIAPKKTARGRIMSGGVNMIATLLIEQCERERAALQAFRR